VPPDLAMPRYRPVIEFLHPRSSKATSTRKAVEEASYHRGLAPGSPLFD
jgi:hypothetical protein